MSRFVALFIPFVTLIAPGDCRMCGGPMRSAANYPVCVECLFGLQARPLQASCSRCGEPCGVESARMAGLSSLARYECVTCTASPPQFVQATAFGLYADLRAAIHLMKFEGVPSLARPLGRLLASAIAKQQGSATHDLLVLPVPLYRHKRAFNQSTLLARSALECLKRAAPASHLELRPDLLRRTRRTESQFLLTAAQRHTNVRGAFEASPGVRGRNILLVDDVFTTGATAAECTRVLLNAGASEVRVATLARAGHDYAAPWLTHFSVPDAPDRTFEFGKPDS